VCKIQIMSHSAGKPHTATHLYSKPFEVWSLAGVTVESVRSNDMYVTKYKEILSLVKELGIESL